MAGNSEGQPGRGDTARGQVDVFPSPDVSVAWASRHIWRPGQALYADPPNAPALWLLQAGSVDVTIGDRPWRVARPLVMLTPQHVARDIVTPDGAEWLSAGIRARLFGRIDLYQGLDTALLWEPTPQDHSLFDVYMSQLVEESGRRDAAASLIREGLARAIVGLCIRSLSGAGLLEAARWNLPGWLATTLNYLRDQPRTGVRQLAALTGFSPAQFRRHFHEWVGQSPRAYLQAQRMAAARRLLETDMTIGEVARAAGFGSPAHFTHLFTRAFGVPPTRYRKSTKTANV